MGNLAQKHLKKLRGPPVFSYTLGLTGKCDVTEFRADPQGVLLRNGGGLWRPYPVEYKRGGQAVARLSAAHPVRDPLLLLCGGVPRADGRLRQAGRFPCILHAQRPVSGQELWEELLFRVMEETDLDSLRGLEGAGSTVYFSVLDEMILSGKDSFYFRGRSRRPPQDPFNAMLPFAYSLLANDCAPALESVGLDSYVGFLHRDRPGRTPLSLDLMEKLRPCKRRLPRGGVD